MYDIPFQLKNYLFMNKNIFKCNIIFIANSLFSKSYMFRPEWPSSYFI